MNGTSILFFEMGLCICLTQPCENRFASNYYYINIRVDSICSKKRLLFSYPTCVLSQCKRLHHSDPWQRHKSVHVRFSSKQTNDCLQCNFPSHEHTMYCKKSADTGPSKHTGCSEAVPYCQLYSNGDWIWDFTTCEAVQIWVWRDARRLCCFSAASEGIIWPNVHLDL